MTRALRIIRWTTLGLIVLVVLAIAVLAFGFGGGIGFAPSASEDTAPGTVSVPAGVAIGGPFHLTDDKGHTVTQADYRGRWMLVFFGYTNCPDECPLTLQKMTAAFDKIGPLADKIAPLFITVDPARDTSARLASYLANFDPRIIGLTGSEAQIAEAANAYRVYYEPARHEESGADLVSHSTFLYLMDPARKFIALLPSDVDADTLAATLRAKLNATP